MTERHAPAALHLRGVTKRYGEVVALDGVDLEVAPGLITTLVGPSGCGKSTLLGVVAGLTAPTAGRVHLGGRDVTDLPAERRGAVLVFQEHRLFPFLTALEDVAFGLRMRGVPRRERDRQAAEMLERVGLGGLGGRRPAELSGGQRQRVALARALVLDPQVLLLDEPLSSLDPHLRDGLRELVVELQRERELTTLVVTHDREEAVAFGDRLAVLFDGRLHQHAGPRDVVERPATGEVARFIGATEVLPGRRMRDRVMSPIGPLPLPAGVSGPGDGGSGGVVGADGSGGVVGADGSGGVVGADGPSGVGGALGAAGADVEVVLRRDRLRLRAAAAVTDSGSGADDQVRSERGLLVGRVAAARYLGTRTRVTVTIDGHELTVEAPSAELAAFGAGAAVTLEVPAEAVWLVPAGSSW